MNINYGKEYFEKLTNNNGMNGIKHNPFSVIDFSLLVLKKGEEYSFETKGREYGLDVISGTIDCTVNGNKFDSCGGRTSVFEGKPTLVYSGCDSSIKITALSDTEIGVGSSLSKTPIEPYVIRPEQCRSGQWGDKNTVRTFDYMLDHRTKRERLSFAEVTVTHGNWATYPPHKHEDGCEGEAFQEELYFYKVGPDNGFGFCAQFGGQMPEDFAFPITNNTIHKQPFGYHTVTSAPGYSICYLAVYAGHDDTHITSTHPDHKWYLEDYERTINLGKRNNSNN